MPSIRTMPFAPLLALALGALAFGACAEQTGMRKPPAQLSDEQVCLQHYEHDPVERDRCHQSGEDRKGRPQDADPHELPVKTDDPNH